MGTLRRFVRAYRFWRRDHPDLWKREAVRLAWETARGRHDF